MTYDPNEQTEILDLFRDMLASVTADGGRKRAAGTKPHWTVDEGHEAAFWRHIDRWMNEEFVDKDSGAHPLIHVAWRALAIAYQEMKRGGR